MAHKTFRIIFIIALVIAGCTFAASLMLREEPSMAGVSPILVSQKTPKTVYELKVLFIGNSYTFFNNLPGTLIKVANSDADNPIRFVIKSVTYGGIGLKELWERGDALAAIQSQHWDYVVLQEQSYWAMFTNSIFTTSKVARMFDDEIKKAGARTLLFTSWARQPGSHWYTDPDSTFLRNPEYMQAQFDIKTQELAERLGAVAIPIGDYWANTLSQYPDMPLYAPDGTHPSPTGSYLNALLFYRYFLGHNPTSVTFNPSDTTPEQAAALRNIAHW